MSNSTCFTKPNPDILLCRQVKQAKNFKKKVLNYHWSNSSPKMSIGACCTKLNPNILLCKRVKQARKFKIIVDLPRQILMYYCVGEQSDLKNMK